MSQKKKSLTVANVLALVCVVSMIFLSVSIITVKDKDTQIANLQSQLSAAAPKLLSVGIQYTDNYSDVNAPFLQVTGYVVNVGNALANNCTINVNAIQDGNVTALDTSATIPSLAAGASEPINLKLSYTGQPLVAYSATLSWTN